MLLVDVLSFQDFCEPVAHLDEWHQTTGKPVLLADAAGIRRRGQSGAFVPNDGEWYADVLGALFNNPGCIGFHLCGDYQRNKARRRGLLDEMERPDQEHVELIRIANAKVSQHMDEQH